MKRILVLTLAAGAALAASVPASAQYYDPGYRYERPPPRWERPPPRWDYDRPRARQFSRLCVTSRGDCDSRPAPVGAGCSCYIPGFGMKRGNIQ